MFTWRGVGFWGEWECYLESTRIFFLLFFFTKKIYKPTTPCSKTCWELVDLTLFFSAPLVRACLLEGRRGSSREHSTHTVIQRLRTVVAKLAANATRFEFHLGKFTSKHKHTGLCTTTTMSDALLQLSMTACLPLDVIKWIFFDASQHVINIYRENVQLTWLHK